MPDKLLATHPLTPERFGDLEALFEGKGCSFARGCWCMFYREVGKQALPAGMGLTGLRKERLRELAGRDPSPGLVGYDAAESPVGWVAVGPREAFPKLQRSSVMRPVDDRPVWSVVCFVVPTPCRGQGVATALLRHAVGHARPRRPDPGGLPHRQAATIPRPMALARRQVHVRPSRLRGGGAPQA